MSWFGAKKIQFLFSIHTGEANSYYPRRPILRKGNSSNFQYEWEWRVSVPGAFKLDHLQPVKPILFSKFNNFLTFILEANSYYPRGLIMRKENSPNSRNGLDRGVCVPGAFKLDHLQPVKPILFFKFYNFFTFILGANSYYAGEGWLKMGKWKSPFMGERKGFQCLGYSTWTMCSLFSWICSPNFPTFSLSYCEANSYYPRGRDQNWTFWLYRWLTGNVTGKNFLPVKLGKMYWY